MVSAHKKRAFGGCKGAPRPGFEKSRKPPPEEKPPFLAPTEGKVADQDRFPDLRLVIDPPKPKEGIPPRIRGDAGENRPPSPVPDLQEPLNPHRPAQDQTQEVLRKGPGKASEPLPRKKGQKLMAAALPGHTGEQVFGRTRKSQRLRLDRKSQCCGKTQKPQYPDRILGEGISKKTGPAKKAGRKIRKPSEGIPDPHFPLPVEAHGEGVDGKIPPGKLLLKSG